MPNVVDITVVSNVAMGYEKIQHLHWFSGRNIHSCEVIHGTPNVGGIALNMIHEVRSGDLPPVAIPFAAIVLDKLDQFLALSFVFHSGQSTHVERGRIVGDGVGQEGAVVRGGNVAGLGSRAREGLVVVLAGNISGDWAPEPEGRATGETVLGGVAAGVGASGTRGCAVWVAGLTASGGTTGVRAPRPERCVGSAGVCAVLAVGDTAGEGASDGWAGSSTSLAT